MSARVDAKPFLERQLHEDGPLLFWRPGPDETRDGMLWVVVTCTNPLCSCRDARIEIYNTDDRLLCVQVNDDKITRRVRNIDGRAPPIPQHAKIFVDVDTGHVEEDGRREHDAVLVKWAREQLDAPILALLQRRFDEAKKRGSSDLVLDFDPRDWAPGDLLAYSLVHPNAPMELSFGGQRFLVDDQHCVRPGCDCEALVVGFCAVDEASMHGTLVGSAWISLDGSKPVKIDPATPAQRALTQSLHEELCRVDPRHKQLADRRLRMRALAPELHRRVKQPPPPATRAEPKKARPNGPCPCGSGRKYKKCCLNA